MIPKILHQTWRDASVPQSYAEGRASWRNKNPDWEYRLWTDEDLDRLVATHYPKFLQVFRNYPNPVQRADAGRYLLLHRYGGVYADLDTTCLSPFDPLVSDERIVLCEEPRKHWHHARKRGFEPQFFNGIMASPQGHPFWLAVLDTMLRCRFARDVLDSTGPLLLSGCVLSYPEPSHFALHSCHLFTPLTSDNALSRSREYGDYAPRRLAVHHWAGSWYSAERRSAWEALKRELRRLAIALTRSLRVPMPTGGPRSGR